MECPNQFAGIEIMHMIHKGGWIAPLVEPCPQHSSSAASQFDHQVSDETLFGQTPLSRHNAVVRMKVNSAALHFNLQLVKESLQTHFMSTTSVAGGGSDDFQNRENLGAMVKFRLMQQRPHATSIGADNFASTTCQALRHARRQPETAVCVDDQCIQPRCAGNPCSPNCGPRHHQSCAHAVDEIQLLTDQCHTVWSMGWVARFGIQDVMKALTLVREKTFVIARGRNKTLGQRHHTQ